MRVPYHAIRDPEQLQALLDAVLAIESDLELPGVLHRIIEGACVLTGARYGALGILDASGKGLSQFVQVGVDDATARAIGHLPQGTGILGRLISDPQPLRINDLATHPDAAGFPPGHPPMTSFLGVPLRIRDQVFGNLYLTEKQGASEFDDRDEALVVALAGAAGMAIDNALLHAHVAELTLAVDRERIARDLHDTIIQRLFATGLSLQSALPLVKDVDLHARVEEAISSLDDMIRQVRTTIFALEPPPAAEKGVRARILEICTEAARSLGFEPEVRFVGAIDSHIAGSLAIEVLSTLREALSNIARHAQAQRVEVEVVVSDEIELRVTDDGVGIDALPAHSGSGLANMAQRAESLGGSCTVFRSSGGGTQVEWHVPLSRSARTEPP